MTSEPEKLLPCPFCGGEAEVQLDRGRNAIGIGCTKCTTSQAPSWDIASESWARRAWNTRLSSPVSGTDMDGQGWVYWNPDAGEEYSSSHPVQSGECCDAERIRKSTAQEDTLWQGMQDQFARAEALSASPFTPIPVIAEAGERERNLAADVLDEVSSLLDHDGIGQTADLIRDGMYDEHEVVAIVKRHFAALSTPATLDNTAVEVETLRERIATLEAALIPFTRNHSSDEYLRSAEDDGLCAAYSFRAGDYRRARAALTAKTEKAE